MTVSSLYPITSASAAQTGMAPAAMRGVDPAIVGAIARASQAAHVDFGYMMAQARQESDFQPNAKAATSSATGLYQFIDSTWLSSVKEYGAKYGLGGYADQITTTESGPQVSDPAMRRQILSLRNDPTISADLAAEMAHSNTETLAQNLGHTPSTTALYLAHFLGATGATQLVKTVETAADTKAADILPQAAAANRAVFYDQTTGAARTVAQIYSSFAEKLDTQIANFGGTVGEDSYTTLAAASAPETSGTASDNAAASLADLPNRINQPMMTMMNTVALTALKLVGEHQPADALSPENDRQNRKTRDADQVAA